MIRIAHLPFLGVSSMQIPSELGSFTMLASVELQQNRITGEIPLELGLIANTTITCNVSDNQLIGVVPTPMVRLHD